MTSRLLEIAALTLAALGLTPGAAHLMELPVKLDYSPAMYTSVTSTLYAWFGMVGGGVQIAAFLAVAILAIKRRKLPVHGLMAAAAASLLVSLLLWAFLVAPVNAAWADVASSNPAELVATYDRLRHRWEFGHVAAFIAWLTGWIGLAAAITTSSAPANIRGSRRP